MNSRREFCPTPIDVRGFIEYRIVPGPFQPEVRDIQETRSGVYLVSTRAGLFEFKPFVRTDAKLGTGHAGTLPPSDEAELSTVSRFTGYQPNEPGSASVRTSAEDASGRIWVGTAGGLFQFEEMRGKWTFHLVDIGLPKDTENDTIIRTLMPDQLGGLWIGAESGLYRRHPDGRTERFTTRHGLPVNQVRAIQEDREGQLWIATRLGLCQIVFDPGRTRPVVSR
ncbi:MAG TPA: two-component regulator propeller domain-containing protein, partial [Terriglobia bacterium]|nr:two-component regulator propeller domain-containing protein [Terriglobia bacterium]